MYGISVTFIFQILCSINVIQEYINLQGLNLVSVYIMYLESESKRFNKITWKSFPSLYFWNIDYIAMCWDFSASHMTLKCVEKMRHMVHIDEGSLSIKQHLCTYIVV